MSCSANFSNYHLVITKQLMQERMMNSANHTKLDVEYSGSLL